MKRKSKILQSILWSSIITLEVLSFAYFAGYLTDKKCWPIIIFIWTLGMTGVNFAIFFLIRPPVKEVKHYEDPSFNPFSINLPEHIKIEVKPEACKLDRIGFENDATIKSQTVNTDSILIFTKDFRTIRINKDEIRDLYMNLIQSEYTFFKKGHHEIEIKITKK